MYATNNLGWIHTGKNLKRINGVQVVEYMDWIYRPDIKKCRKMYKTGKWIWNINYQVFTVDFALKQYKKAFPKNYRKLMKIQASIGTKDEVPVTREIYPTLEEGHSDELWASAKPSQAVVLKLNLGWSDPGTLHLLKKTLQKSDKDNVTKGKVIDHECEDCLIYNYEKSKLVAVMNQEGMIVVNTEDALLVVDRDHVRFLGDMLKKFPEKRLKKYL